MIIILQIAFASIGISAVTLFSQWTWLAHSATGMNAPGCSCGRGFGFGSLRMDECSSRNRCAKRRLIQTDTGHNVNDIVAWEVGLGESWEFGIGKSGIRMDSNIPYVILRCFTGGRHRRTEFDDSSHVRLWHVRLELTRNLLQSSPTLLGFLRLERR